MTRRDFVQGRDGELIDVTTFSGSALTKENRGHKMKYVATMIYHAKSDSFVSVLKKKGPPVVVGLWNFVGGKIEDGETAHTAHAREALEETGIDILEDCTFVSAVTLHFPGGVHVEFARFDIHARLERPILPPENDIGELLTWGPADLKRDKVVPNLNWLVPLLLSDENLMSGELYMGST